MRIDMYAHRDAHAHKYVYVPECIDVCIAMRTDICVEMCVGMCSGVRPGGMCIDMCTGMCTDMCTDMCTGMCHRSPRSRAAPVAIRFASRPLIEKKLSRLKRPVWTEMVGVATYKVVADVEALYVQP